MTLGNMAQDINEVLSMILVADKQVVHAQCGVLKFKVEVVMIIVHSGINPSLSTFLLQSCCDLLFSFM